MAAEIAVGAGHDGAEKFSVLASGNDGPQGPASQRRHLDGSYRPGQLGGEHALDILIGQSLGRRDDQIRRAAGEPGGAGLVGQPGSQAGNEASGADPLGEDVGGEEVLLHELAEGGGELVLAPDDQRGVRYRQAQGMAEEGRHREPVGDAADHGGLRAGLHKPRRIPWAPAAVTAANRTVTPARRAVARRRAAARPRARRAAVSCRGRVPAKRTSVRQVPSGSPRSVRGAERKTTIRPPTIVTGPMSRPGRGNAVRSMAPMMSHDDRQTRTAGT